MTPETDLVELVRQAQLGDQESIERLAEMARQRLSPYVYRLTLDHDVAEDLLQETLLKMIEALKDLRQPESFWSWLFRTALGVVQHHYRDRGRQRRLERSAQDLAPMRDHIHTDHEDGLSHAMRRELSEAVLEAMAQLKLNYRSILTLRCYEQMSYAEIASTIGCKELRARVLFFRARHSLARQLKSRGFGGSLLLTALGLFGALTAPTDEIAAGTVSASAIKVGIPATLAGWAGTPHGIAVTTITALCASLTLEHLVYAIVFGTVAFISFVVALNWE